MNMHKKIIAFAVSLETDVLNGNRLILLTNAGLLSALPLLTYFPYVFVMKFSILFHLL